MTGDEIGPERVMRGRAFCDRWLVPLHGRMIELLRDGRGDLEWAIPADLWDADLFDGPTAATFRGLPFVKDATLTAPTVRPVDAVSSSREETL